jgi:hypothetical protein
MIGVAKMKKSQKIQSKCVVIFLTFALTNLAPAKPRPCVSIELDVERHVNPYHLKLTYHIPPVHQDDPIIISIAEGPVKGGAGLIIEHIATDGEKTVQSLPPEPWWFTQANTLEITSSSLSTYLKVWTLPWMNFDLSKPGIYSISYVHPWIDSSDELNNPVFRSNTLTITFVSPKRYDELYAMLRQNPELALVSYKFKNPPSASEMPKYRRKVPEEIDTAIKKGARQDEVLFLLGSPEWVAYATIGQKKTDDCRDESWHYETSPVGGYAVMFKNGRVVKTTYYADSPNP